VATDYNSDACDRVNWRGYAVPASRSTPSHKPNIILNHTLLIILSQLISSRLIFHTSLQHVFCPHSITNQLPLNMSSSSVPSTCCGGKDTHGNCACSEVATCTCGKQKAGQCNCEKSATENKITGATCSCSKFFQSFRPLALSTSPY